MKKNWSLMLRLAVTSIAIGVLAYALRGKIGEAFLVVRQGLQWKWLLFAIGIYLVALSATALRLQLVFKVQGVKVSYPQSFYLTFLGLFFNLFFPSALGGDVAKGYFAYQFSGKKLGSLTGVLLDRLLGLSTIVLITLAAVTAFSQGFASPAVKRGVYISLGILLFGIFFFSSRRFAKKFRFLTHLIPSQKWRDELSKIYHAIREFRNHKSFLVVALLISLGAQFFFITVSYLLGRSLGIEISFWIYFLLLPLIFFVSMAPSLSGLGVREAGFIFFFKPFMPVEKAFALSLLNDFLLYGVSFLAGLVYAFRGGLKKEVIHDLERAEQLKEVGHDQ